MRLPNLKQRRLRKGLTVAAAARLVKTDKADLWRIENAQKPQGIEINLGHRIAEVYEVTTDQVRQWSRYLKTFSRKGKGAK